MELKFYELIGVRKWKQFVLWLSATFVYKDSCSKRGGNYYLKGLNITYVKEFRKALIFNGIVHLCGILVGINFFIHFHYYESVLSKNKLVLVVIANIIAFYINFYCTLLQRYNWLRIKKVIKKQSNRKTF